MKNPTDKKSNATDSKSDHARDYGNDPYFMEFKANSGLDKLVNLIIPEPFFVHSDLTTGIHYSTSKHHRRLEGIMAKNQKCR